MTIISKRAVKKIMADRNIDSLMELSRRAKLGQTTVYEAISGKPWRSSTLDALANALECDPRHLLEEREVDGITSPEGEHSA